MANFATYNISQRIKETIKARYDLRNGFIDKTLLQDAKNLSIFLSDLKNLDAYLMNHKTAKNSRLKQILVHESLLGLYKEILKDFYKNNKRIYSLFAYKNSSLSSNEIGNAAEQDLQKILDKTMNEVFGTQRGVVKVTGQVQGTTVPWSEMLDPDNDSSIIKRINEEMSTDVRKQKEGVDLSESVFSTTKSVKTDVEIQEIETLNIKAIASYQKNEDFLASVGRALNGATFSVKSYGDVSITLGHTKFYRIIQGIVREYNYPLLYSDKKTASLNIGDRLFYRGQQIIDYHSYYDGHGEKTILHQNFLDFRFIYELAGAGIYIKTDDGYAPVKNVKYLVFNNNDPTTKSTSFAVIPTEYLLYYFVFENKKGRPGYGVKNIKTSPYDNSIIQINIGSKLLKSVDKQLKSIK